MMHTGYHNVIEEISPFAFEEYHYLGNDDVEYDDIIHDCDISDNGVLTREETYLIGYNYLRSVEGKELDYSVEDIDYFTIQMNNTTITFNAEIGDYDHEQSDEQLRNEQLEIITLSEINNTKAKRIINEYNKQVNSIKVQLINKFQQITNERNDWNNIIFGMANYTHDKITEQLFRNKDMRELVIDKLNINDDLYKILLEFNEQYVELSSEPAIDWGAVLGDEEQEIPEEKYTVEEAQAAYSIIEQVESLLPYRYNLKKYECDQFNVFVALKKANVYKNLNIIKHHITNYRTFDEYLHRYLFNDSDAAPYIIEGMRCIHAVAGRESWFDEGKYPNRC